MDWTTCGGIAVASAFLGVIPAQADTAPVKCSRADDIPLHRSEVPQDHATDAAPLPVPVSPGPAVAPVLGLRFEAAQRPDTADPIYFPLGIRPPDTMGAIGPDHFMEVINGNVSIFNKITGSRISSVALVDFFAPVHTEDIPFDPRVLFDQHSGRWVAMAADCRCDPNTIVFAVSRTADPTGDWFLVGFPAGGFADYPTLGVDEDAIYVAAAFVNRLWVIEKAPLLADPPALGAITAFPVSVSGALHPAHTWGAPGVEYLVQTATSTTLRVFEVHGPMSSPTLVDRGTLPVPAYSSPLDAPALGSTTPISVGSGAGSRLQNALYRDGSLWTCHTILQGGRDACRWYEIDPVNMSLVQSGTVADGTLWFYYPTIAANAAGDVAMGFSGSSAAQFVAAYYTGRYAGRAPGTMAPAALLKPGESTYTVLDTSGRNRWGDYSHTTLDPEDEMTFWTIQEYAGSPADNWGTWVGQLSFDGFDCNGNLVPDADDISGGSSPDLNGNGVPDECECPQDCAPGGGDGEVGIADFLALLAQWGQAGTTCDFDGGPGVGIGEFLDLLGQWGTCNK